MLTSLTAIGVTGAAIFGIGSKLINSLSKDKEMEEIRYTWLETLIESGCKVGKLADGTGKTFDLLEMERIPNGFKAKSLVPNGMSVDALKNKTKELEAALNSLIIIEKDRYDKNIWVKIINRQPKFDFEPVKTDLNHLWLGYKHDGVPFKVDLDTNPHFVFAGGTGSGKTFTVVTILTNLFINSKSKNGKLLISVYLAQIAKSDFKLFEDIPHVKKVITKLEENVKILEWLVRLSQIRNEKMVARGVTSISDWNKKYGKEDFMERIFWIGDELAFFMPDSSDDENVAEMKARCWDALRKLGWGARSAGISILVIVQRATAKCLGGDGAFKSQLTRFSLKQNSEDESRYIIDKPDAANLLQREAIFSGDSYEFLVVPTLKNGFTDLKRYIPEIKVAEDYIDKNNNLKLNNKKNEVNFNEVEKSERIKLDKPITREELKIMRETGVSLFDIRNNKLTSNSPQINMDRSEATSDNFYFDVIKKELNTARDKDMLKFMENSGRQRFKALTLDQIHKLFYYNKNNPKSSYKYCAERLNRLASDKKQNVLEKYSLKEIPKETIYFIKEIGRKYSYHDLQPVNVFIKLKEIEGTSDFKIELTPNREAYAKRFIPDALITFNKNGVLKRVYVEIDYTHFCGYKIPFYERMRQDEEFDLIIIKDSEIKEKSNEFKIIKDNFEMNELANAFV